MFLGMGRFISRQMYGHVEWLYMSCWWEHILLKIQMILKISEKLFQWVLFFFSLILKHLLISLFITISHEKMVLCSSNFFYFFFCKYSAENNGWSIQNPRLRARISGLQAPSFSNICCQSYQGNDSSKLCKIIL